MNFEFLFTPVEQLDDLITVFFHGAPLRRRARHRAPPRPAPRVRPRPPRGGHLTGRADDGDTRGPPSRRVVGIGHGGGPLALGIPLIAFKVELPGWLESAAEKAIGVVILAARPRVIYRWARPARMRRPGLRTARQACHRLAPRPGRARAPSWCSLIAALPTQLRRARAGGLRPDVDRLDDGLHGRLRLGAHPPDGRARLPYRADPGLGVFGLMFGPWYAGLGV